MKLVLVLTGKTDEAWLREGMAGYEKRITKYCSYEQIVLPDIKNSASLPPDKLMEKQGEKILSVLKPDDLVILLDERGKEYTTLKLAAFLQSAMCGSRKRIVFIIGGAWGVHRNILERADHRLALSQLTFSHQMVRILFTEQLYRVLSVIAGDPYHHE